MDTQAYIPANVYRAFLKMALAILPNKDVPDYAPAYDSLLNGDRYNQLEDHKFIKITESRVLWELPFVLLFQKKKEHKNTCFPLHVFCIYVRNYMFQIIFPLSNEEMNSANVDVNVNDAPYMLIDGQELDNVIIARYRDELYSFEPQKRDSSIHMKLEDGALDNLVCYSKENGFQKVNLI